MKIIEIIQGSQEWHAHRASHFNASDAPAMMGVSPYKTRSQLLHEMATGIVPEVDVATQRRFDDGHRCEALARPLAEQIVGQDLYPVTGSEGRLSASFDGLTLDELICFEHKRINEAIRAALATGTVTEYHAVQMEQQLHVSGAEMCLFMATNWNGEELAEEMHIWYKPDLDLRARIVAGWAQFEKDLAAYVPVEVIPAAVAAPIMGLPALSIQVNGSISLISNLDRFGAELNAFVEKINMKPEDDQGFADAEAAVKTLQIAQDALEAAEAHALAQTASIDDMRRAVKLYTDTARTTRLMLEKMVKARKESIRIEIVQGGKDALADHVATLNKRLAKVQLPPILADFAGVIKGKKTIASLRESVNNELLRAKMEASALADKVDINLNSLRELAKDHAFLFADTPHLVLKANDDLVALIKMRITEHQQAEAVKEEAARARIQAEEQAKAEAKVRAEQEAKDKAERENAAKPAEPVPAPVAAPIHLAEVPKAGAQRADISARPTDSQIIGHLAVHYSVSEQTVRGWLSGMNLRQVA